MFLAKTFIPIIRLLIYLLKLMILKRIQIILYNQELFLLLLSVTELNITMQKIEYA